MSMPKWNRITIDCFRIPSTMELAIYDAKLRGASLDPRDGQEKFIVDVYAGNGKKIFRVGDDYRSHRSGMEAAWRTFALFVMDPHVKSLVLRGPNITDTASYRRDDKHSIAGDRTCRYMKYQFAMQEGNSDA